MRRVGDLWGDLASPRNLYESAHAASRGKRFRPDVAAFNLNLESNVAALYRELVESSYRPGAYSVFTVFEPKRRRISVAPFRDRVVHHALVRQIEPIFERCFTRDSFACRRRHGTHAALARAKAAARRHRCVLKCDIVKFFPSVDHEILLDLLARKIKCRTTLDLARLVIANSNPQDPHHAYFRGDDLFGPYQRRRGLPIGNQTSQFFANVYLNPLDHYVRESLGPTEYIRYCDDFLLFGDDRIHLEEMRRMIEEFLAAFRLRVHPGKTRVYRCVDGFTFLGWRVFPTHTRLARANVIRFKRRARGMQRAFAAGDMSAAEVRERIQAWVAHASHGDTWRLRGRILGDLVFRKGCGA